MQADAILNRIRRLRRRMRQDAAPATGVESGPVELRAFGQRLDLAAPVPAFLRDDTLWRLRHVYEPALALRRLGRSGVAVDIGAGFGGFALPFARAFPGWTVWCFEPDPAFHAALVRNIADLGLENVIAFNLAVAAGTGPGDAAARALQARDPDRLRSLCAETAFRHDPAKPGYLEAMPAGRGGLDPRMRRLPTLPAQALAALEPQLLKLLAPRAEAAILEALAHTPIDHVIGESWAHVPARLVCSTPGRRETWLPRAGAPALKLRHAPDLQGRRAGLDIAVAMYDSRDWIVECVESLIAADDPAIRVRVIDDGSTDGGGDLVRAHFADRPQVSLHRKPNGGCASARNFGRLVSDATHIAFVDADDVADADLFPHLLELARHTGAEIVQGGFDLLQQGDSGRWHHAPGPEGAPPPAPPPDDPLGSVAIRPAADLMTGQPSIWRRVYRRDFLDNRDIWFPEHIRAFDDLLFQLLSLQHARDVPVLGHLNLHYRQHPGQDIRRADERGFYALEMFRLAVKRGLSDGWENFAPLLRSYVNTVAWTHGGLRDDLKPAFLAAAAELWVLMHKALGSWALRDFPDTLFAPPGFAQEADRVRMLLDGLGESYAFAWLDSAMMHAGIVRHLPPRAIPPMTEPR